MFKDLKPRGNISSPIWLIGDSDPVKSGPALQYVLDNRHPVIHNIWTPIIYNIQKKIFKEEGKLVDDDFFMINAISDVKRKPVKSDEKYIEWTEDNIGEEKAVYLKEMMKKMKELISKNNDKIKMLITFGKFSFEFIRRCEGEKPVPLTKWKTRELRSEFVDAIKKEKRIVPLLHRSISSGNFVTSHKYFSDTENDNNMEGDYFKFVSENLYRRFIKLLL